MNPLAKQKSLKSIIAALKKPIPNGLSNSKTLAILKNRLAQGRANPELIRAKKSSGGLAIRLGPGTQFEEESYRRLMELADSKSPNARLARALERVYRALRESEVDIPVEEHAALARIQHKILSARNTLPLNGPPTPLTVTEASVLNGLYKWLKVKV